MVFSVILMWGYILRALNALAPIKKKAKIMIDKPTKPACATWSAN